MPRSKKIILLLSICFCLIACDENKIFEENLKIKDAVWLRSHKAQFQFDIVDTSVAYNIYLNFRHAGDYPYSNLYLFTKTISPTGQFAKDTAQMLLANTKGKWMGKGIGDIFDYQFKFKDRIKLPMQGAYTFEIEQAMRSEKLPNVTDIGIRVEKVIFEQ